MITLLKGSLNLPSYRGHDLQVEDFSIKYKEYEMLVGLVSIALHGAASFYWSQTYSQ